MSFRILFDRLFSVKDELRGTALTRFSHEHSFDSSFCVMK